LRWRDGINVAKRDYVPYADAGTRVANADFYAVIEPEPRWYSLRSDDA
jgi:hypothetical protein